MHSTLKVEKSILTEKAIYLKDSQTNRNFSVPIVLRFLGVNEKDLNYHRLDPHIKILQRDKHVCANTFLVSVL